MIPLLIVAAGIYLLFQTSPATSADTAQTGGAIATPPPGSTTTGVTHVGTIVDTGGGGGGGGGGGRPGSTSYVGGPADSRGFMAWLDSIPLGCEGSHDPRCKPGVLSAPTTPPANEN